MKSRSVLLLWTLILSAVFDGSAARAAVITWGTPADITTNNSDVATTGISAYAYNWTGTDQTVNGVTFTGTTATNGGGADVGLTSTGTINNPSAFTSSSTPFSGLSAAYKGILTGADYAPNASETFTVTLSNLIDGDSYAVQVWVNDPRGGSVDTRTETISSGNTVTNAYSYSQAAGSPGQYTIGTFTAAGNTQSFTMVGTASTQINALQVRNTSPTANPGQNLFVSDSTSGNIYEFTTNGTQITFATGLASPKGLAFNSSGILFAADESADAIYTFSNGVQGTFTTGLNSPVGLAFNSAGVLFEADFGSGKIYDFSNGVRGTFTTGLNEPAGLAFNSAGVLFVAAGGNNAIFAFTNGVEGTFAIGLDSPRGLAFNDEGVLFESDQGSGTIYAFTNGVKGTNASGLSNPTGLACNGAGVLFEADQASGNIFTFSNGVKTTFATGLSAPAWIAFEPQTAAFSALTASQTIVFGTNAITLSGTVSGSSPVAYPAGGETITVTIDGNAQSTTISGSNGGFSFSYDPSTLPTNLSPYTITYTYAGDLLLYPATNTSTTLTVKAIAPVATTGAATSIGPTNATLNATVNPGGAATAWYFQYGASPAYGSVTTTSNLAAGDSAVSVSNVLSGLLPGTVYYYRIVASNSVGTNAGAQLTFTNPAAAPAVTTLAATSIGATNATLNATVNPGGAATAWYFQYGASPTYGSVTTTSNLAAGDDAVSVSNVLGGLQPGAIYYYRIIASNSVGTNAGAQLTFTNPAAAPAVTTLAATSIGPTNATLNAMVNPDGAATAWYFQYGASPAYGSVTTTSNLAVGDSAVSVSNVLTGLTPGATYHYQIVASNVVSTSAGVDMVFTDAAASYFWDAIGLDTSPGGGGTGNWDASTADWWLSGASDVAWNSGNNAIFAGAAGTVTVTTNVIAQELVFDTAGYLVTNSGSATVTLTGNSVSIPSGVTTIGCALGGTDGLTVSGSGTLILAGQNTYSGATTINPGNTLMLGGAGSLRGGSYAGGISLNGTLTYASSAAQTFSGAISGAGALNVSGPGTLILSGADPYTGAITINSGSALTLRGQLGSSDIYAGNIANNGTFDFTGSSETLSGVISGSGTLQQNGGRSSVLTLSGPNTFGGSVVISSGTLALSGTGSIVSATNLTIASGAAFNVPAFSSYTLSSATTLSAGEGGGESRLPAYITSVNSTVNLGSQPISLAFNQGNLGSPILEITAGGLTLNANTIAVSNESGSPLGDGTYTLISVSGGTINGAPNATVSVTGAGVVAGTTPSISVSGGNVNLVVVGVETPVFSIPNSQSIAYGTTNLALNGTLSAPGPLYPASGEMITVTINGNAQTTTVQSGGLFSINYNPSTIPPSEAPYPITYSYGGDALLHPATNTTTTLTVNPASDAVLLSSSSNPSVYGQAGVTFTASVSNSSPGSSASPTGTVQFQTNGVNFGSAVTLAGGSATSLALPASSPAGICRVTAAYSGDGNFSANSALLVQFMIAHGFTGGTDGANPYAALILSGNTLYGTASDGGTYSNGTVFAINANGTGFTNLYSFTGGTDGANPDAALILSGNTLYGTASSGGTYDYGTVFAINTNGTGFTNLYSFSSATDGANPQAGLILSGNTLYGTASSGGTYGAGTVFAINTNGTGFTNLYTFTGGTDGGAPRAGLILSGTTLYGTSLAGGTSFYGTVFSITTNGMGFTNLYSFTDGTDGAYAYAGLILSGNTLYGTAFEGGTYGNGTVFTITTNGTGFTNLYSFTGGTDGAHPYAGLILSGNTLYGTALEGGTYGNGTVFTITTNGTGFTNLYSFTGGTDGAYPDAGLILSGDTLYGTASQGGTANDGTVFGITPGQTVLPLPVILSGDRLYDGTATATNSILSVENAVGSDNVNVNSGSATLAGSGLGIQPITSFGTLTLGGANAPEYTLTGASGYVQIFNPFNPFSLTSASLDSTGTNFVVCWTSVPGANYVILTNTDLTMSNAWNLAGPMMTATNSNTCFTLPGGIAGHTKVFVRIIEKSRGLGAALPPPPAGNSDIP